ncbi:MAG: LysR substrate-binding domain-containing protein [Thioalkalivibrionaceae bacterium]
MTTIDLRLLDAVQAVHEAGGFARAAERLCVTPSALSHAFREWETRHGTQFFQRRPLKLTPAGERVLEAAQSVLPRMALLAESLDAHAAGRAARWVVALECHSCFQWLMPALVRFRRRFPEIETDVRLTPAFDPWAALDGGDADWVVSGEAGPEGRVLSLPLGRFRQLVLAASDHPLAGHPVITPQDLAGATLVTYPVAPERLDVFRRLLWPAGVFPARRAAEGTTMVVTLVAAGQGVAVLPDWVLREQAVLVPAVPSASPESTTGKSEAVRAQEFGDVRDAECASGIECVVRPLVDAAGQPLISELFLCTRRGGPASLEAARQAFMSAAQAAASRAFAVDLGADWCAVELRPTVG